VAHDGAAGRGLRNELVALVWRWVVLDGILVGWDVRSGRYRRRMGVCIRVCWVVYSRQGFRIV
jgi:hypothetical protein